MFCNNIEFKIGSLNTIISLKKNNIIYEEPTVVAIDTKKKQVIAVGNIAKQLKGRNNENIKIIEPIKDESIIDVASTIKMLKYILKNVLNISLLYNSVAKVVVSIETTKIDYIMIEYIFKELGFKKIEIKYIENRLIKKSQNMIILNCHFNKSEIFSYSFNNILISYKVINEGYNDLINKVKLIFLNEYNIISSDDEISRVVKIVDELRKDKKEVKKLYLKGRDSISKLPKLVEIDSEIIKYLIECSINKVIANVIELLKMMPVDMKNDIKEKSSIFIDNGFITKNSLEEKLKQCIT